MRVLRHNIALMAVLILVMAGLGLAGCMNDRAPLAPAQPVPRQIDLKPVCSQVRRYSPAEEAALAKALEGLDGNSPIVSAMGDYKRMRDQARACQAAVAK